jgi:excisionase family DNA binding protein
MVQLSKRGYEEIHQMFQVDDDIILHVETIAEMVGMTQETVRSWCRSGKLPSYQFGKKYIVTGSDFKEFMKLHRVKPSWNQAVEG